MNNAATAHPFEIAGLGIAPFRYIGSYESKFQAVPGDPNCPVRPGSSCDYCGMAIMQCCAIQDANGKRFKVGSDCALKTGDRKLVDPIRRAINKARTEASHKRADAKIAALMESLQNPEMRTKLAALPHPNQSSEYCRSLTRLDWCEWQIKHSGRRGKVVVAEFVAGLV